MEVNLSSPRDIIITAVRRACEKTNPAFEGVLETHLQRTAGKGLELAYENPRKFKESLKSLFGEYSARFFEMLIINEAAELIKLSEKPKNLEDLLDLLRWWS